MRARPDARRTDTHGATRGQPHGRPDDRFNSRPGGLHKGQAPKPAHGKIRRQLIARTRDIHNALHHHAVLRRLLADDLTLAEYHAILRFYLDFYEGVEQRRRELVVWPGLALVAQCAALRSDLARTADRHRATRAATWAVTLDSAPAMLGALYVLHGAGFGAAVMVKRLTQTLPQCQHAFFSTPLSWDAMDRALESFADQPESVEALCSGAQDTFAAFAAAAGDAVPAGASKAAP